MYDVLLFLLYENSVSDLVNYKWYQLLTELKHTLSAQSPIKKQDTLKNCEEEIRVYPRSIIFISINVTPVIFGPLRRDYINPNIA